MHQAFDRQRREFLQLSGIAAATLLLAPVLTKLNLLQDTLRVDLSPGVGDSSYGSSPYGGKH